MTSESSGASDKQKKSATPAASQAESSNSPESESGHESTESLTESVTNYPVINGRRYHRYKEGSYVFPNDEPENDRLDLQHKLLYLVHGGRIFFAPLRNPRRILDVGTGTGIWAIEMGLSKNPWKGATYFPNATIIGTDLSPIQPTEVPANVHFVIDDASEPDWEYQPHECFDYIFARCLLGSLSSYKMMIKNAFKYLNPGTGFLECHEWLLDLHCDDDSLASTRDYPFRDWISFAHQSSATSLEPPRPLRIAHKIAGWMREAGFVDVHEKVDVVPINAWSRDSHLKNIGKWHMTNWLDGLGGFSYGLFGPRGLNWTQTQIEVFLIGVRKSIQDKNVRAYQNFYCITGRKPKVGEGAQEDEEGVQKEDEGLGEEGEGE